MEPALNCALSIRTILVGGADHTQELRRLANKLYEIKIGHLTAPGGPRGVYNAGRVSGDAFGRRELQATSGSFAWKNYDWFSFNRRGRKILEWRSRTGRGSVERLATGRADDLIELRAAGGCRSADIVGSHRGELMCDGGAHVMLRVVTAWLALGATLAAPGPTLDDVGPGSNFYNNYPVLPESGRQTELWSEGPGAESAARTTTKRYSLKTIGLHLQVTQKRAALVLDRLLVALQHALREDRAHREPVVVRAPVMSREPLAEPLQHASSVEDLNEMTELQRRGQTGGGRGRVLRCYFNAVTCF
ncbi:hypothetical protein EVAR_20534_1 [Eumeta japonica]|uniref:Uncharacterized protein n=1 Tax=Eumeta variegata TaxID=151549 RepID=A0A4C1VJY4_EUMVA|nr:hypothetical protein EVAR_20534_1 [Eumeta japonica]